MRSFRDSSNSLTTPSLSQALKGLSLSQSARTPSSAKRVPRDSLSMTTGQALQQLSDNTPFRLNNTRHGLFEKKPIKREITPTRNNSSLFRGGDRFHPARMSEDYLYEANHLFASSCTENEANTSNSAPVSPSKVAEDPNLPKSRSASFLLRSDSEANAEDKIFCYKPNQQTPISRNVQLNQTRILYTAQTLSSSSTVKKTYRYISTEALKTLDAPQLNPDVYRQLLDWSACGLLAVALYMNVYGWDMFTGRTELLIGTEAEEEDNRPQGEEITALRWSTDGRVLAVGYFDGTLKLYTPEKRNSAGACVVLRRIVSPSASHLGSLVWRPEGIVSAGFAGGQIIHFDITKPEPIIGMWLSNGGHRRDITSMEWDPRYKKLATSSSDWTVCVWAEQQIHENNPTPLYILSEHTSQVRCVKWCPFKNEVLATGGGQQQDGMVKLWSIPDDGKCFKTIETKSAVSSIIFNSTYKEMLVATDDGYLKLFSYGNFKEQANIAAHPSNKILRVVESHCGEYVYTASSDEMLKMFHLFKVDKSAEFAERRKNPYTTVLR